MIASEEILQTDQAEKTFANFFEPRETYMENVLARHGNFYHFLKLYVRNLINLYEFKVKRYESEVENIQKLSEDTKEQVKQIYKQIFDDNLTKAVLKESGATESELDKKTLDWTQMEERIEGIKEDYFPRYNSTVGNLGRFEKLHRLCKTKLNEFKSIQQYLLQSGGGREQKQLEEMMNEAHRAAELETIRNERRVAFLGETQQPPASRTTAARSRRRSRSSQGRTTSRERTTTSRERSTSRGRAATQTTVAPAVTPPTETVEPAAVRRSAAVVANARIGQSRRRQQPQRNLSGAALLLKQLCENLEECYKVISGLGTDSRKKVRNELCQLILNIGSPIQSEKHTRFLNICITGDAGLGKSTAADCIGKIMSKSGILCSDGFGVDSVTPKDFKGEYLGQTAIKTFTLLQQNLERVLFCDEAYGFVDCNRREDGTAYMQSSGGGNQYGQEAMTEMLAFLDKYQGMHVLIVAGYHSSMINCFFNVNPGLMRRFPSMFDLQYYTPQELFDIFAKLVKPLTERHEVELTDEIRKFIVENDNPKEMFKNQAGDIQNLFGYYQSYLNQAAQEKNLEKFGDANFKKYLIKIEKAAINKYIEFKKSNK